MEEPNPSGLCMCGCGERTQIAKASDRNRHLVRGKPRRYLNGHQRRGSKHSAQARRKMSVWDGKRGAETPAWKGAEAKYSAIHMWLSRNYTKTGVCEECGESTRTEWANVSGDYTNRDRSNWRELCRPCHLVEDHARPKRPANR